MLVQNTQAIQIAKPNQKTKLPNQPAFGALQQVKTDTVSFGNEAAAPATQQGEKLAVLKNVVKGIFKPVKDIIDAVIKAPVATGLVVAATAAVIHFLPIVGTALAVGIAAAGAYQIAAGTIKGISEARQEKGKEVKDYADANKQFRRVGEGIFDLGLTLNAAIKGIKEVQGTISAIGEASQAAQAVEGGKGLTGSQKLYAILKQVQTRSQVEKAPKTYNTVFKRIIDDGKAEFVLLKEAGKVKKSTRDLKDIIDKVADPAKKEELVKLLDNLSDVTNKSDKARQITQAIRELLAGEKVTGTDTGRLLEIIDTAKDQPAVLAVLKSAMKTGTVDDAAKTVGKLLGKTRYTDEAGKVVATTENIVEGGE